MSWIRQQARERVSPHCRTPQQGESSTQEESQPTSFTTLSSIRSTSLGLGVTSSLDGMMSLFSGVSYGSLELKFPNDEHEQKSTLKPKQIDPRRTTQDTRNVLKILIYCQTMLTL